MPVYHQMGHDSWNLVSDPGLKGFSGLILSPVNDSPGSVITKLKALGELRNELEIILDPQFYKPSSDRGQLAHWAHFTDEVDTVDMTNTAWWDARGAALIQAAKLSGADATCSPAMLPKVFSDDYYRWTVDCANRLNPVSKQADIDLLLTAIVRLTDLTTPSRADAIASILTNTDINRCYLVFYDDIAPRVQRTDSIALTGAGRLIRLLKQADMRVLVAFSGLDLMVWKGCEAADVATGKFFNLRRFVPGRWDDPVEGGRIVPYWTDGGLIAWLREDDLKLLDREGLVDRASAETDPFAKKILEILDSGKKEAWVGLAWRQYLTWFRNFENLLDADADQALAMLKVADTKWAAIEEKGFLLFDRTNSGNWIRTWYNAIQQSKKGF